MEYDIPNKYQSYFIYSPLGTHPFVAIQNSVPMFYRIRQLPFESVFQNSTETWKSREIPGMWTLSISTFEVIVQDS